MATSLPSFCSLTKPSHKPKLPKCPPVRCQSFHNDEGNSANMVDANLGVLRERIREVKKKESLERCFKHENGWNYKSGYDNKHKVHGKVSESIELLGLVSSSLGFVFLFGSFSILLVSFVVHLHN
ncbi:Increased rDNA silencing protein [Actinidia chinensis var. chinensis]|uniref:Increased rDNA silencing protein n=1 Tax=Actinidia chinensis var. chinensis TaxID=1590841 RepID=A0A2R6QQP7_ACTCC|nr:Increased rDNA silencing protein [Actinidia chinensis var. chinensis]